MIVPVLWWLAMCAGLGAVVYLALWGIDASGVGDPFRKVMRLAVIIGAVGLGIMMIFRLFALLGHPIA